MAGSVSPPGKYPGVYVRTLIDTQPPTTGVATSVGAFIGRTARGPVNTPVTCNGFADFQRTFGGLDHDSAVSYQVNGFFANGGAQAEIVRLYRLPAVTIKGLITDDSIVAGTYQLVIEPLVSGPTVTIAVDTDAGENAGTVYQAFADALETESALAGMISNVTTDATAGLSFDISYPSQITGDDWAFTNDGSAPAAGGPSSVSTGSGSARVTFDSSIQFALTAASDENVVYTLSFAPTGGAPFSVTYKSVTADTDATQGASSLATALYKAVMRSSQAGQLVHAHKPGASDTTLTLDYLAAVSVTLTAANSKIDGSPTAIQDFYLDAANPGPWGNSIVVSLDQDGLTDAVAQQYGLDKSQLFNLTAIYDDGSSAMSERFVAVTLANNGGAQRLDRVLLNQSTLLRLTDTALLGGDPPVNGSGAAFGSVTGTDHQGKASDPLADTDYLGDPSVKSGLYAFEQEPYGFNIMCIPPDQLDDTDGGDLDPSIYQTAAQICVDNNAMLIIDPPTSWYNDDFKTGQIDNISLSALGSFTAEQARACAVYFPRIVIADPLRNGLPRVTVPCGYVAAVWASVDQAVGVWKAPAGLDAPIGGILELQAKLTDTQNGVLNPQGINALRYFTGGSGNVVWGARTLRGADQLGDQYKYVPVQRLLDYIETSLLMNTRWAVFQPNGEALWAKLTDQITTFMNSLFTQGAFAGTSAKDGYFVQCDASTTTPADQAAGIVNVSVGFAPLYPAEFVVITITQKTASSS
jgi:phage tail sheath protein FI